MIFDHPTLPGAAPGQFPGLRGGTRDPAFLGETPRQNSAPADFRVVGLAGGAGSLAAFEQFFRAMPAGCGMAFVVMVLPAPGLHGVLAQALQGFTAMPVQQVLVGVRMRPNHVYVAPPNGCLRLLHGTLQPCAAAQPAAQASRPIDFFFESLARDARERAVCIVCSGRGNDGSLGLKAVLENFGLVMVQAPATAEFDGMPNAALATEFVDFVLPAAQLAAQLLRQGPPAGWPLPRPAAAPHPAPAHALQTVFSLIRARTGHDFSQYKRSTVLRRIERRMHAHRLSEFTQYVRFLQLNEPEVDAVFKELLIGVTQFFRDQPAFEGLKKQLLKLLENRPSARPVRVWAPGCSTGEEAYSLAITLFECFDELGLSSPYPVQIFATDLSPAAVAVARTGRYAASIAADVSSARLHRFFEQEATGCYRVKQEVRDVVDFSVHNLHQNAPFAQLDLLVCRNLLIYLNAALQKRLIPMFHAVLNPGGLLFLGSSESCIGFPDLFEPVDLTWKISRRAEMASWLPEPANFSFSGGWADDGLPGAGLLRREG